MGISGHMLGEKKLRKLQALTHLPLNRAWIRNGRFEGRYKDENGACVHVGGLVDLGQRTASYAIIPDANHWSSCEVDGGNPDR